MCADSFHGVPGHVSVLEMGRFSIVVAYFDVNEWNTDDTNYSD